MNQSQLRCIAYHFAEINRSVHRNKPYDFARPCEMCPHNNKCDFDWVSTVGQLQDEAGVRLPIWVHPPILPGLRIHISYIPFFSQTGKMWTKMWVTEYIKRPCRNFKKHISATFKKRLM